MSLVKTIRFTDYDALGFDMDYTLARYELVPFFDLVYECVCDFLVKKKNYDSTIFHKLHEDKDLVYKGLIVDFEKGNVLKLGHDGVILRASHGTTKLTDEEIERDYGKEMKFADYDNFKNGMKSLDGKWRFFENYFDLPGLVVFARIIDSINKAGKKEDQSTYEHIWADVLSALEEMYIPQHFDKGKSRFFDEMKKGMSKYIDRVSIPIKDWLKALRQDGRKVFFLTSSYPDFANLVMDFMFGSEWKSYFDVMLYGGRKPKFFTESSPFIEVENLKLGQEVSSLKAGGEYCHGNYEDLMTFLKELTGKASLKVIYFGDNLWADAWPSKTLGNWDAVLVLEEMDAEGYAVSDGTVPGFVDETNGKGNPKEKRKYAHSSLVTTEEIELMTSEFWGSVFIDESVSCRSKEDSVSKEGRMMNTAFGDLISLYSDICVPSIEYLAGVPVDHEFTTFGPESGNPRGFHPGLPKSLCLSQK